MTAGDIPDLATAYEEGERAFAEIAPVLDADPGRHMHGEDGHDWAAKHVYSHFDRWQRWTIDALAQSLETRKEIEAYANTEEMEAINARWASEAAGLTFDQAREQCLQSRADMQRAFLALSEEDWRRWGRLYSAEFDGSHYRGHLQYIRSAGGQA